MRTDRELLELAAKAVGIKGVWCQRGLCIVVCNCAGIPEQYWRPLEDDGDALRLMHLIYKKCNPAHWIRIYDNLWGRSIEHTRRAIVIAAAEIGAAM